MFVHTNCTMVQQVIISKISFKLWPKIFVNQNFFWTLNFFRPNICLGIGDFHWRWGIKPFQAEHFRLKSCSSNHYTTNRQIILPHANYSWELWWFLTLLLMAYLITPTLWGGCEYTPLLYGYRRIFSIFFYRGLVLDIKCQNPKEEPSIFKIVVPRNFWKLSIFAKILKNWKFAI